MNSCAFVESYHNYLIPALAARLAKAYFKLSCERIPLITFSLGEGKGE